MSFQPARGNALRDASNREIQKPRQNLKGTTNTTRRPALGIVSNNVTRKQPLRAAKDRHSVVPGTSRVGCKDQENQGPNDGKAAFAVFEDVRIPPVPQAPEPGLAHMEVEDKENMGFRPVLDAVIGLNPHVVPSRRHIATEAVSIDLDDVASPMVVDHHSSEIEPETAESPDEFGIDTYIPEIYAYMRAKEVSSRPNQDYMNRQVDVSKSMRNILIDWLVEVGEEYKLHRETLFLAINYIDRFLSLVGVQRPKLQLVGAACMFIAAKYEEIYPPEVGEFVYITDDTYTKAQVLKMESVILKLLDFQVAVPTINWFCDHFLESTDDMNDTSRHLTFFLAELSLIEIEEFLRFNSSLIAACCILLARSSLGFLSAWSTDLERASGYAVTDLLECVRALFDLYTRSRAMPQQAVVEKYKQESLGRVAYLPPLDVLEIP